MGCIPCTINLDPDSPQPGNHFPASSWGIAQTSKTDPILRLGTNACYQGYYQVPPPRPITVYYTVNSLI